MDTNCTEIFKSKLPEIEIIWAEKPRQGIFFSTQDFFLLPFSMFGCGFAYFLITMPQFMNVPHFVALIGWVILLISLYFFIIRFAVDSNIRAKTCYALSEDHYHIFVGHKIISAEIPTSKKLKCDANVDSSGDIWFKPQSTLQLLLGNSLNGLPFYNHPHAFLYISNVKTLFKQISEKK
jgi:hypothetical protein